MRKPSIFEKLNGYTVNCNGEELYFLLDFDAPNCSDEDFHRYAVLTGKRSNFPSSIGMYINGTFYPDNIEKHNKIQKDIEHQRNMSEKNLNSLFSILNEKGREDEVEIIKNSFDAEKPRVS